MKTQFSTFDIERALRIERGRLREWQRFVRPSVPASGQGTRAGFTRVDVYGVALFRRLIEIGFRREEAGKFVRDFQEREKGEPERQRTECLVFRRGKKGVTLFNLAHGKWRVNLETGAVEWAEQKNTEAASRFLQRLKPGLADQDWEMLHIMNLRSLYQEVDAGLARP